MKTTSNIGTNGVGDDVTNSTNNGGAPGGERGPDGPSTRGSIDGLPSRRVPWRGDNTSDSREGALALATKQQLFPRSNSTPVNFIPTRAEDIEQAIRLFDNRDKVNQLLQKALGSKEESGDLELKGFQLLAAMLKARDSGTLTGFFSNFSQQHGFKDSSLKYILKREKLEALRPPTIMQYLKTRLDIEGRDLDCGQFVEQFWPHEPGTGVLSGLLEKRSLEELVQIDRMRRSGPRPGDGVHNFARRAGIPVDVDPAPGLPAGHRETRDEVCDGDTKPRSGKSSEPRDRPVKKLKVAGGAKIGTQPVSDDDIRRVLQDPAEAARLLAAGTPEEAAAFAGWGHFPGIKLQMDLAALQKVLSHDPDVVTKHHEQVRDARAFLELYTKLVMEEHPATLWEPLGDPRVAARLLGATTPEEAAACAGWAHFPAAELGMDLRTLQKLLRADPDVHKAYRQLAAGS